MVATGSVALFGVITIFDIFGFMAHVVDDHRTKVLAWETYTFLACSIAQGGYFHYFLSKLKGNQIKPGEAAPEERNTERFLLWARGVCGLEAVGMFLWSNYLLADPTMAMLVYSVGLHVFELVCTTVLILIASSSVSSSNAAHPARDFLDSANGNGHVEMAHRGSKGASSRFEQTASLLADDGDLEDDDLWDHADGDVNPFAVRARANSSPTSGRGSPVIKRRS
jgi:hypothetical protein